MARFCAFVGVFPSRIPIQNIYVGCYIFISHVLTKIAARFAYDLHGSRRLDRKGNLKRQISQDLIANKICRRNYYLR